MVEVTVSPSLVKQGVYVRKAGCMSMDVRGRVELSICVQAWDEQAKCVLHTAHYLQRTALMRRGTRGCKAVLVLTFLRRRHSPLASPRERSRCALPFPSKVNMGQESTVRCGGQMVERDKPHPQYSQAHVRSCRFDACRWDIIGSSGVCADRRLVPDAGDE